MLVKNPSHRKSLNSNQVKLLSIIFKFRFVTVPLLAEYVGKDKSTIYEQLLTLSSQNLIAKNYDSSYRLPPRAATYCLAAKGIKYLRENTKYDHKALRNMFKNGAASDPLVERSLTTMALCHQLKRQYPDTFDIFAKSEMSAAEKFIRPLPDLWLRRKRPHATKPQQYFLEILEPSVMRWIVTKRIRAHETHAEENDEYQYPHVLLIAGNDSTERRVQRILSGCYDDFEFWTTTAKRLASGETKIWWQPDEINDDDKPILLEL